MLLLRIVKVKGEVLVTVCDKELLGKTFKRRGMRLEVKREFYCGREASLTECMRAIKNATIANLVGSVVEHAVKAGLVRRDCILYFQGVPHAQLVRML
ncbi:MAG: DUF424 family protein [Candidatus Hadarchaeales archaeon]